jgi:hypothetical protein
VVVQVRWVAQHGAIQCGFSFQHGDVLSHC